MGKKLATVLAAVVATGHQGAVVQTAVAVQVTCGYSGQVYTRPSPPPATGPALTTATGAGQLLRRYINMLDTGHDSWKIFIHQVENIYHVDVLTLSRMCGIL